MVEDQAEERTRREGVSTFTSCREDEIPKYISTGTPGGNLTKPPMEREQAYPRGMTSLVMRGIKTGKGIGIHVGQSSEGDFV